MRSSRNQTKPLFLQTLQMLGALAEATRKLAQVLLYRLPKYLYVSTPKFLRSMLIGSTAAVLMLSMLGFATLTKVPPGSIGVRQDNWGGGIVAKDYDVGIYLGPRGLVSWHLLDGRVQVQHFTDKSQTGPSLGPLEIRTKDNNSIQIDLTVSYRIRRGEAYRLVERGWEFSYGQHVTNIVKNELRKELATLSSEDWFDPEIKIAKIESIRPRLRAAFEEFHLECLNVQIHGVSYPGNYQKKLQETQIQHQRANLFRVSKIVEDEEARVETYREETNTLVSIRRGELENGLQAEKMSSLMEVQEIESRAKIYKGELTANADNAYALALSEGNLEIKQAEADGEEARLAALSGLGGRLLLARDAADKLKLKSISLDTNHPKVLEMLNLNDLVKTLIGAGSEADD